MPSQNRNRRSKKKHSEHFDPTKSPASDTEEKKKDKGSGMTRKQRQEAEKMTVSKTEGGVDKSAGKKEGESGGTRKGGKNHKAGGGAPKGQQQQPQQKKAVFPSIKGLSERNGYGEIGNIMATSETSFVVFMGKDYHEDDDGNYNTPSKHVFEFSYDEKLGDWRKKKDPFKVPKGMSPDGPYCVPLYSGEPSTTTSGSTGEVDPATTTAAACGRRKYLINRTQSLGVFDTDSMKFEKEIVGVVGQYGNLLSYQPQVAGGRYVLSCKEGALYDLLTADCINQLKYRAKWWFPNFKKNPSEKKALAKDDLPSSKWGNGAMQFGSVLPDGRIAVCWTGESEYSSFALQDDPKKKVHIPPMLVLYDSTGMEMIHEQPATEADFLNAKECFTLPNGTTIFPGPKPGQVSELCYADGRGFYVGRQLAQLRVLRSFSQIAVFPNGTVLFGENYIGRSNTQFEFHDVGLTKADIDSYCIPIRPVAPSISIRNDDRDYDDKTAKKAKIVASDRSAITEIPPFPETLPKKLSLGLRFGEDCINLKQVHLNIGPSLFKIQEGAFVNCTSLESVVLELADTFQKIGPFFCCDLPSLKTLELKIDPKVSNPFEIGTNFVNGCPKLSKFVLPTVSKVGACFLYGCTNLTEIDVSAACPSLTSVEAALGDCSSLTKVDISGWSKLEDAPNFLFNSHLSSSGSIIFPSSGELSSGTEKVKGIEKRIRSQTINSKCPLNLREAPITSSNREYKLNVNGTAHYSWANCGFQGGQGTDLSGTWSVDPQQPTNILVHFTCCRSWCDYGGYDVDTEEIDKREKLVAVSSNRVSS